VDVESLSREANLVRGVYRHFQGEDYVLLDIAKDVTVGDDVVVYRRVDSEEVLIRPAHRLNWPSWLDLVEWPDGQVRNRFTHQRFL
jgi:hypothetical protein